MNGVGSYTDLNLKATQIESNFTHAHIQKLVNSQLKKRLVNDESRILHLQNVKMFVQMRE